jgi:hypothetical protein
MEETPEMLEMKSSMDQIQTTIEITTSRQDQSEERLLGVGDKIKDILYSASNMRKINMHDYNL